MGLSEKLEQMADEKERERGIKDINRLFSYLEGFDVEGLDIVLSEIRDLQESGRYVELINAYRTENNVPKDQIFSLDELLQVRVLKLARDNLRFGGFFATLIAGSLITAKQFLSIYSFIEFTYCLFTQTPTNWEDAQNIYFSRLDERIIFALDHFDKVSLDELPEPTSEYFQKLRKLKWKNKKTKELYNKLISLMFEVMEFSLNYSDLLDYVQKLSTYRSTEDLFILTLAGCSAVNDDRSKIEAEDVVIAYKTFFKLIKTDVTKYKVIPELVNGINGHQEQQKSGGYLVSDKCGRYYELQKGEPSDDFEDCQCGNGLKLVNSIDNSEGEEIEHFNRGMIIGIFSTFLLFCTLKIWGLILGGSITSYMTGTGYNDGAKNAFIVSLFIFCIYMILGGFIGQVIPDFTDIFDFPLSGRILGLLIAIFILPTALVGSLIGTTIRKINRKHVGRK